MNEHRPAVSIIVVTYNSKGLIEQCLAPLTGDDDFELIAIDNASIDGTPAAIRSAFPSVTVLENSTNVGFAAAVNRAAAEAKGRAILLLNPDATVSAEVVRGLAAELAQPEAGVVGPRITHPQGRLRIMSAGRQPLAWRMASHYFGISRLPGRWVEGHYLLQPKVSADRVDTEWVTGACLMCRADLWHELGGLSERWFMYAEDIEFCRRVRLSGHRVVLLPRLTVTHQVGSSAGPISDANPAWVVNLFDYYRNFLAPTPMHALVWKLVVTLGLLSRSCAFRLKAALPRPDRAQWRRESTKFRLYAAALWKQNSTIEAHNLGRSR